MKFETKASGERDEFDSGSRRDKSEGKTRPDLIPAVAQRRVGDLMARGIGVYGERNWELGQPISRFFESLERHVLALKERKRDEDHAAAIVFNANAIMFFEGTEWDDWFEPVTPEWEQLSFDFSVEQAHNKHDRANEGRSYINWDSLTKAVDEGRADAEEIAWPEGHPYRKVDLRKASEG